LKDGQPVPLTPKAFDTLLLLVENSGRLIEKEELMKSVWPDSFVEENNLNRSIYLLRKALGDSSGEAKYIETVPKSGYRFVGSVVELDNGADLLIERHTSEQIITEEEVHWGPSAVEQPFKDESRSTVANARTRSLSPSSRRVLTASVVVVIAILGLLIYFWSTQKIGRSANPNLKSIAVLPLKSLNENADDKALSLGFADALITSVRKTVELRVISINGVTRYTDSPREPLEIGQELHVDGVFEGTLQKANGKIRVTLRLIRISDGKQVWSGSFDESESNLFHLEDEMAARSAQALAGNLRPQDAKRPTESREAYQAYLLGRFFFDKRTHDYYDKAIAEFERAIALDPNYGLAYTGLADAYALQANADKGDKRDELYEKSRATATKALELDESLAEAHTSLGWIKRTHDWDWAGSELEFRRALELNPNYANAHQWYALLLLILGRKEEAQSQIEQARELEPLSTIVLRNYFTVVQYRREYERLPALAEQIASLGESPIPNLTFRAAAYSRTGNSAKLIEIVEADQQARQDKSTPIVVAVYQALAYTRTGQLDKAREVVAFLKQEAKVNSDSAYRLATIYAELGRKDEAIALLERCYGVRDDRLVWLKVEPFFDSLRSDPRFQDLLRRMNLG
jgi:DNA-binding winged helix-turn-helix (wHTH) protein/TolB-like protein/Flp pilus assembly protein TadD